MKKLLCMSLSVILTLSMSFASVYAQGQGNGKPGEVGKQSEKQDKLKEDKKTVQDEDKGKPVKDKAVTEKSETDEDTRIANVREQLEQKRKDKEERNKQIKEIVKHRKEDKKDHSTPVFVRGKELVTDVPPVIKDGRTLIPVRAVTNALGAEVAWDADTRTVTVTKAVYGAAQAIQSITIVIKLDSDLVLVNGKQVKIDVPAQTVSNRTFVPLRFIAETFKQKVEWESETGSVIIEDEEDEGEEEATPAPSPTPAPAPESGQTPEATPAVEATPAT